MKPVIGIVTRPMKSESQREIDAIYQSVKQAILQKGGLIIGIPLHHEEVPTKEELEEYKYLLSLCNGILLQGGEDFYPLDIWITRYIHKQNIPTLGICLGMQTMSVAVGGLMEDLKESTLHQQLCVKKAHHVHIRKDSRLYNILKQENIVVNSRHHSYIVNTKLHKIGYAEDGILEAVEDPTKRFFIGVQWHPEDMITYDMVANFLLEAFIKECKE